MTYELIQSALTATIEAIAFIAIIGLPAHYIATTHAKDATPEPEVATHATPSPEADSPFEEPVKSLFKATKRVDTALAELQEIAIQINAKDATPQTEIVQEETETLEELFQQADEIMTKPIYEEEVLPTQPAPAVEKLEIVESEVKPQPEDLEIDLNALDSAILRRLCTQNSINWRNVRGKNRHATKAMMVYRLQQQLTA